ncbi:TniQ family protein [Acidovorax sp. A1169]|uniref:TniQ family protein n=1 Tax=Acidovorax sp. A1169 TaxID=3059524 RepID=UPI0035227FBC
MSSGQKPGPLDRELLTSWLARVAIHDGCDPLVLTSAIWPKWRVWTVDADRSLADEHVRRVASWFGLPPEKVTSATLMGIGQRLHGSLKPNLPLWPWIVSLGNRNRLRRAGMPFCPECLASDTQPYYRLDWRLAWIVGCELHGARLVDRCERCGAVAEPHRSVAATGDLAHCVACGFDLRCTQRSPVDIQALGFQLLATRVFNSGAGDWGNASISASEWFRRMRSLAIKDLCKVDKRGAAALGNRQIGLWFELQGPIEREARMRVLSRLVSEVDGPPPRAVGYAAVRCQGKRPRAATKSVPKKIKMVPIAKARVQEDWARWLRRNRLW